MNCESVILAAGLGTRMKSRIPKVLHILSEKPLIWWAVQSAYQATGKNPIVVIGPEDSDVRGVIGESAEFVEQQKRLGTGHAVMQTADRLRGKSEFVLVTLGDMPLLRAESLKKLIRTQADNDGVVSLMTATVTNTRGFGRILRDGDGKIVGIVEEAHATAEKRAIREVNVSAYCFQAEWFWEHLSHLPLSPKGEYYLTDIIEIAVKDGSKIDWVEVEDESEIIGINTREHLAEAQAVLNQEINRKWMLSGVTIVDPRTTYIGPDVEIGMDTIILPNTTIEGETIIGEDCKIGPSSVIQGTSIADRCRVFMSVLERAVLEEDVDIGPYAHLRAGARLCRGVHMGNFGEVKNSTLGPGVKMGHFSYVGDSQVGQNTNVSAGVITCNYDGEKKHETVIGENVFIGSDTMLVAPLTIGKGARTGAGSVVTKDVPEYTLVAGVPARGIRKLDKNDGSNN
jgi:bifunctional UDP-N-acetylglucosamine pyrophosphorylase/glucosamine-1-phosphate N-acetyltransferase